MKNIESVLKLNKIVFDKIEFNRLGFKNDKELELNADDLVITDSEGAVALAGVMAERKIRSCRRRNA